MRIYYMQRWRVEGVFVKFIICYLDYCEKVQSVPLPKHQIGYKEMSRVVAEKYSLNDEGKNSRIVMNVWEKITTTRS